MEKSLKSFLLLKLQIISNNNHMKDSFPLFTFCHYLSTFHLFPTCGQLQPLSSRFLSQRSYFGVPSRSHFVATHHEVEDGPGWGECCGWEGDLAGFLDRNEL